MKNKLTEWRSQFPVTQHAIYVNHAAVSPVSLRVKSAIHRFLEISSTTAIDNFDEWMATRDSLRGMIAGLVNAESRQIAFVKNTSAGLCLLTEGLRWKTGDRIILADCEFPSNVYPFLNLKSQGVEIDFVRHRDGFLDLNDFEKLITPRTRMISVSFVEFMNGFRNDLESLGAICKRHNLLFCVDSIQGLGAVPLDVNKAGIDFLSNGGHKWLMAPIGIGFIYLKDELLAQLKMSQIGWLSVKNAWQVLDYQMDLVDDARRFEGASENWIGVYGMKASLGLLQEAGIEAIYYHLLEMLDILAEGLRSSDWIIASSMKPEHRSGILSFQPKAPLTSKLVHEALAKNKVECSVREGLVRISPHFYNSNDEMHQIVDILPGIKP